MVSSPARAILRLVRAGGKRVHATLRPAGSAYAGWAERSTACARCPISVGQCGKLYCGRPLLRQLERDESTEGCGCPIALKSRDPAEHCPRNVRFEPSTKTSPASCDCIWCVAVRKAGPAVVTGTGLSA